MKIPVEAKIEIYINNIWYFPKTNKSIFYVKISIPYSVQVIWKDNIMMKYYIDKETKIYWSKLDIKKNDFQTINEELIRLKLSISKDFDLFLDFNNTYYLFEQIIKIAMSNTKIVLYRNVNIEIFE